jgi:hypothetical protein
MNASELLTQITNLLTTAAHLDKQATRAEKLGEAVYHMRVEANAKRQDAAQLAAIAQAEALCRIAECMEALTDERTASVRLAEAEATIAAQEHEIEQLGIINRELGEDIENLERIVRHE